jgi:hypothetical protein
MRSLTPVLKQGGAAGDCETAAAALAKGLPGGCTRRWPVGAVGHHEVYIHNGLVLDPVAAQYTTSAAVLERVGRAGLRPALETGVFTIEQHIRFMEIVRGCRFTRTDYAP